MPEAQQNTAGKAPWHLWAVGVVGLLWSSMGAFDYLMTQTRNEAYLSGYTPEALTYFFGFPSWVIAFWAIAVWGGVIGAIFLLLRKAIAVPIFLVSLAAFLITAFHNYVLTDGGMEFMGDTFSLIFTAVIFLASLGLYLYSRTMQQRGVIT